MMKEYRTIKYLNKEQLEELIAFTEGIMAKFNSLNSIQKAAFAESIIGIAEDLKPIVTAIHKDLDKLEGRLGIKP